MPLARVRLELEPRSRAASECQGWLNVTVCVWRTGSPSRRAYFKPVEQRDAGEPPLATLPAPLMWPGEGLGVGGWWGVQG